MQKIRLWEVSDGKLAEIQGNRIPLEEQLEDWLASDISALDQNLLVIGRQVETDYGGFIDLLCLDSRGDTVVVELKKGKTPREVTAQALDYSSWVRGLSAERLAEIADRYFASENALAPAFQDKFSEELPGELNLGHRSLVVAEEIDASTERIVRYLSDMNVPVNVATVQHFRDKDGREILAQVYLIEPEEAEAKAQSKSNRTTYHRLASLQSKADENGIGELFANLRNGVRGMFRAQTQTATNLGFVVSLAEGRTRTVFIALAKPDDTTRGMEVRIHATRLQSYLGISWDDLRPWLPETIEAHDIVRQWSYDPEERTNAVGYRAFFTSTEEVDRFLDGLRTMAQSNE